MVGSFAAVSSSPSTAAALVVASWVAGGLLLVAVLVLAVLALSPPGAVMAVLLLVPLAAGGFVLPLANILFFVGVIMVLNRATQVLKDAGLRVGLFGANADDLRALERRRDLPF